jgi:4-hydroxy-3-methylbut-2-en-1-yl diphosphate reductase
MTLLGAATSAGGLGGGMNRTVLRQSLRIGGVITGEVLVTTMFRHPVRGPVPCPAAPLVGAAAARAGAKVRYGTAALAPGADAVLFTTSYVSRDGTVAGLGAAANAADATALAAARSAVGTWSAALRTRRVLRAAAGPLCPGARRALDIAGTELAAGPVFVYGNPPWPAGQGMTTIGDLSEAPPGARIVFPAHGVSPTVRAQAAARRLTIIDATCPLVQTAQAAVRAFAEEGDTVVVIGRDGHAVVNGLVGQAPERVVVAQTEADLPAPEATGPLSYVLQPGVPVEELTPLAATLRDRHPARPAHPSGWCYDATDRAATIRAVAADSDVLFILGAADSPDSAHLARLASATQARIITGTADIRPEWIARAATIGLAEAATTGPGTAELLITALSGLGPLSLTDRSQTSSTMAVPGPMPSSVPVPSGAADEYDDPARRPRRIVHDTAPARSHSPTR